MRASAAVGPILLFLVGTADHGLCGDGKIRTQDFAAPIETQRKLPDPHAIENESPLVVPADQPTATERQRSRDATDKSAGRLTLAQRSNAAHSTAVQARESAPAPEQKQAIERELERDRVEALARAMTASLRAELYAVQSAADAERIKLKQAFNQERDRADRLARELAALQAELGTARIVGKEAAQAIEISIRQTEALEQERDKANDLARELSFLRTELEVARISISKAVQAAEAEIKSEQALELERDRAENLVRELVTLRTELDAARIAASEAMSAIPAETEQRQALERELKQQRDRADDLARELTPLRAELDAARIAAAEAGKAIPAEIEQRQALERELKEQRDRAEDLARKLAPLRVELDAARTAAQEAAWGAEAARVEQKWAFERERDRAETLARQLASERKLADERATRLAAAHAEVLKVTETNRAIESEQKLALANERERADAAARELASVRSQLDAGNRQVADLNASRTLTADDSPPERVAASRSQTTDGTARSPQLTSVQAAAAETEQREALEWEVKQQRDRTEDLARELAPLRAELDAARAAAQEAAWSAEATQAEQKLAFEKERDRAETLARQLASERKLADERSTRLAAAHKERDRDEALVRELASERKLGDERSTRLAVAHAEIVRLTETSRATASEQKLALASERERADTVARELASVRNQLDAGNRQLAPLNASRLPTADDGPPQRVADSRSQMTEGTAHSPQRTSDQAAALNSERSSAPELRTPAAQSTAREPVRDLEPKVSTVSKPSTPASAAPRSLVDEHRLLARAIALLRQADISGARPLLEHAVQRGSARAAFMLAETYDARVLQSWRAHGISGDHTKARELYERAQAGGIEDATERIKTLHSDRFRSSPIQDR